MSVKYVVIAAHRAEFARTLLCRVLDVARSGVYAAPDRAPSTRAQAGVRVAEAAHREFRQLKRRDGSPRVQRACKTRGVHVGEKRVARLRRAANVVARRPRRFIATTDRVQLARARHHRQQKSGRGRLGQRRRRALLRHVGMGVA